MKRLAFAFFVFSGCVSTALYPARPAASTSALVADPLPAKLIIHVDATAEGLDRLFAALGASARISARYRWLVRDLVGLVHADPELEATYRRVRRARFEAFGALARGWRAAGLLRDEDDERLDDVVGALWIVAETWWPFAELDDPDPDPEVGARLARSVLEPYLTGGAR